MTPAHLIIAGGYLVLVLALLNWSRSGTVRVLACAFFISAIGATGYAAVDSMGRARPVALDIDTRPGCYAVHAFNFAENRAIYLWLNTGETDEPLLLALPWDLQKAQSLVDAAHQAAENGAPLQVGLKGSSCGEAGQQGQEGAGQEGQEAPEGAPPSSEADSEGYDAAVFYAAPPPELPPKS